MKPQSYPADAQERDEARRRPRREKLFDASDIRLLILYFLSKNSAHGYELIKQTEALAKGEYAPSPGMIYPNLTLLEELGYIRAAEETGKKCWQMTDEGRAFLLQQPERAGALVQRLESMAVLGDNRRIPEVQRAIHNFRVALNTRLSGADIPRETLHQIIDILDEAAKRIERS